MAKNLVVTTLSSPRKADAVYRSLCGMFCIYKPPDMDLDEVNQSLKHVLVKGLNLLPREPPGSIVKVHEQNDQLIYIDKDYSDTKEALGASYVRRDFKIGFVHPLDKYDSGVQEKIEFFQVGTINDNRTLLEKVTRMRLMRVYHVKARLGVCTEDFTPRGRFLGRSSYLHVNRSKIDRLMATVQASYQREMFKHFGIDVQSQEAFEMASKGLLRPQSTITPPQIYSIRCIEFDRPFFKMEIHCINESTLFLRNLVHDCGLRLKTHAICVQTRRVRDGFADVNSSDDKCLAFNEWTLDKLQANIAAVTNDALEFIDKHDKSILVATEAAKKLQTQQYEQQPVEG